MINVPQEFTLNPTLVEVLTALDQVQHPSPEPVEEPRDMYGRVVEVKAPSETLRSHLVSWHNQLVTAQRAKSDADERATGFQKAADNYRRENDGLKQKVAGLEAQVASDGKLIADLHTETANLGARLSAVVSPKKAVRR